MKLYICLVALAILCMGVICAPTAPVKGGQVVTSKAVPVRTTSQVRSNTTKSTKPSAKPVRSKRDYGASYGSVAPAPVQTRIVQQDFIRPIRPVQQQRPIVVHRQRIQQQAVPIPHRTVVRQQIRPVQFDVVAPSYGQVQTTFQRDLPVAPQPISNYGQTVVHETVVRQQPALDFSSSYGQSHTQTFQRDLPVAPVVAPQPAVGYSQTQTTFQRDLPVAPVVQQPVVGYGQAQRVQHDTVIRIEQLEPEWRNLCMERRAGESGVFYLQHPTRQTFYIQCDEHGQAFLKECPAGTVFTLNLVCENANDLHPIESKRTEIVRDVPVGSYGAVPSFGADTVTIERSGIEFVQEAPEFRERCTSRRAVDQFGTEHSTLFYFAHPTNQNWFIQCDESGRAFLKTCPVGLIFSTHSLVCQRPEDIEADTASVSLGLRQTFDITPSVVGTYGSAPTFGANSFVQTTVLIQEAPEFRDLCSQRRSIDSYGTVSAVFYIAHPTNQNWFIQCDENGKAFVRECPSGLVFSHVNLVCENLHDVVEVVTQQPPVMLRQEQKTLDVPVVSGSYGAAPQFGAETVSTVERARVEVFQEAPEFKDLCSQHRSMNTYGTVSAVFYIAHPTNQNWFIQCDENGRAFLRECPTGLIFSQTSFVCERAGEIVEVVTQPTLGVSQDTSYASSIQTQTIAQDTVLAQEAPEFRDLCLSKQSAGVAIFYIAHPTKQTWFIQCDENGRAFIRECPAGTIFTRNLVCESLNDLHDVADVSQVVSAQAPVAYGQQIQQQEVVPQQQTTFIEQQQPSLDIPVAASSSYGSAPQPAVNYGSTIQVVRQQPLRDTVVSQPVHAY